MQRGRPGVMTRSGDESRYTEQGGNLRELDGNCELLGRIAVVGCGHGGASEADALGMLSGDFGRGGRGLVLLNDELG